MPHKKFFNAAIFLASFLFVLIFSTSTSPLYDFYGDDSAIFQAVGRGWAEGLLPYVNLFENKGPLIFLIDALGWLIYPRAGIFLFQIPAMYVTFLLAWRSLGLFLSGRVKIAAAIFMTIFYAVYYLDGNRTEEWSMPFLMAATYFFLRGLKNEKFSYPPLYGFIYGLGFGACVLLRMMNAAPLCLLALLSTIFLIQARQYKILLKNILSFCAGAVLIVLPFVIYFAIHGALYEMLYGTILFNLNYTSDTPHDLPREFYAIHISTNFMPLIAMTILSPVAFIKDKSKVIFSGFFVGVTMLILMIKLRPYVGYCTLIEPIIPLLFIVVTRNFKIWYSSIKKLLKTRGFSLKRLAIKFFIVFTVLMGIFYFCFYSKSLYMLA